MPVSVFDLFKVGVGPSSSHTVGPMRIAADFLQALRLAGGFAATQGITVHLYGSLALTGRGHATDRAVALGLMGFEPDTVNLELANAAYADMVRTHRLALGGRHDMAFVPERDIVFHGYQTLAEHPNGMRLVATDAHGQTLLARTSYSLGGGFVAHAGDVETDHRPGPMAVPHPYTSASELLVICQARGLSMAEVVLANEVCARPHAEVMAGLDRLCEAMMACMDRGLTARGVLPGGLAVPRRARQMHEALHERRTGPLRELDWVNAFAVAVNEENAAGGHVVTAPTNGAAGIIPAVMRYHAQFCGGVWPNAARTFLLTATAIGSLYKENASISGAEVGCQGEVGVASSMAAAGLTAVLGGQVGQIENAAEIAMEHHLGMTCDPVGGLVQIPCIERNAMGAVKAINAARLAMAGDGTHQISLDRVIRTMRQTGADMSHKYKETSLAGLAVSVVAC